MKCFVRLADVTAVDEDGHLSYGMLTENNGCVAGCSAGISVFTETEFPLPAAHDDQEGFLVLEGSGFARVGETEFPIEPEVSFIVPAGTPHCIKKDLACAQLKVFWFHSAVK